MVAAPYCRKEAAASSVSGPTRTALGSPSRRAIVSSSRVVLRTVPSTWGARTRDSAISGCSCSGRRRSDEALGGEEVDERLGAHATVVGDDLPSGAGRPGL